MIPRHAKAQFTQPRVVFGRQGVAQASDKVFVIIVIGLIGAIAIHNPKGIADHWRTVVVAIINRRQRIAAHERAVLAAAEGIRAHGVWFEI